MSSKDQKTLEDPKGCEICHTEYVLFISWDTIRTPGKTDTALMSAARGRDICGGCRQKALVSMEVAS